MFSPSLGFISKVSRAIDKLGKKKTSREAAMLDHSIVMSNDEYVLLAQEHHTGFIIRYIPAVVRPYAELMRLHRPTYLLLSLLPSLLGMLLAANFAFDPLGDTTSVPLKTLLDTVVRFGAVKLLLAGGLAAFNDIIGNRLDKLYPRRRMQPVARGAIMHTNAIFWAFTLMIAAWTAAFLVFPQECREYAILFITVHAGGLMPDTAPSNRALLHGVALTLGVWTGSPALGVPLGFDETDVIDTLAMITEKQQRIRHNRHLIEEHDVFGFWMPGRLLGVFDVTPGLVRSLGDPPIAAAVLLSAAVFFWSLITFVLRHARITAFDEDDARDRRDLFCGRGARTTLGLLAAMQFLPMLELIFILNENSAATGGLAYAFFTCCSLPLVLGWTVYQVDLQDPKSCEKYNEKAVTWVGAAMVAGLLAEYLAGTFLFTDLGLFISDLRYQL